MMEYENRTKIIRPPICAKDDSDAERVFMTVFSPIYIKYFVINFKNLCND